MREQNCARHDLRRIAFDAPVGKIDTKSRWLVVHRGAGIKIARPVLRVDLTLPGAFISILKVEEIHAMVKMAEDAFGKVDVLINNAGVQHVSPIDEFPEAKWDLIIGVNLSAAFHTCKAVWKGMKERGFGRIINIASAHGLRASEFKSAYVSSKHGILGLTKVLGLEGASLGITCNAICPGYVKTPLVEA
ncbi:MAG: SDR family NAD(P)-dependent oxidoreductase, partial [Rhodospirillales bacterium]|nr:SDR family NAD(P)-dependent oxidoreductase [Rhodospirillales bacterium]